MSLIRHTKATDTVTVILRAPGKDTRNSRVPVEVGRALCSGRLQPTTATDVERYMGTGTAVAEMTRFITAEFPGDGLSQVITPDGVVHDVVGRPQRHRPSPRTSRDIVILSATKQTSRWGV